MDETILGTEIQVDVVRSRAIKVKKMHTARG